MAERNTRFSELTGKEKVEHVWEYYKIHIAVALIVLLTICYIIYRIVNPSPDTILGVGLVNSYTSEVEENVFDRYLIDTGHDPAEEVASVRTGLTFGTETSVQITGSQTLTLLVTVGDIDLFISDEEVFEPFASNGCFTLMENILTEEQMEKYADRLYTATIEEDGAQVIVGIWLEEDNPLVEDGYYDGAVLVGIPHKAEHKELAIEVLLYLLGEE